MKAISDTELDELHSWIQPAEFCELQCLLTEAWMAAENPPDALKEQYDKSYTYIMKVYSAMVLVSFHFLIVLRFCFKTAICR